MARAEVQAGAQLEDWGAYPDQDLTTESQLQERAHQALRGNREAIEGALREGAVTATRAALLEIYRARFGQEPPQALHEALHEEHRLHVLRQWLAPFATMDLAALSNIL